MSIKSAFVLLAVCLVTSFVLAAQPRRAPAKTATTTTTTTSQGTVTLIEHDALGRTRQATAQFKALTFAGNGANTQVTIEYTTDQLYCSAFGP